jgi:hypothetical protein
MGYYSQVRYPTTQEGFEKIKKLAKQHYEEEIKKKIEGKQTEERNGDLVVKEEYLPGKFVSTLYNKEMPLDFEVQRLSSDGKYMMFGYDWVKWMGYDHLERKSIDWACEHCGELVRCIMVGEDGEHDEEAWNNEDDDYEMPYVGFTCSVDDDAWV